MSKLEKKISGFHTINGKETEPFWIVHKMSGGIGSAPLVYWTLKEAKEYALAILRGDTTATIYIFYCDGIYTSSVNLIERKISKRGKKL